MDQMVTNNENDEVFISLLCYFKKVFFPFSTS
jgi:hypothetical protein